MNLCIVICPLLAHKAMQNKLEAMEMWCFRRILKISWVKRVSNVDVLARCNEERSLIRVIRQRQLKFIGHIVREESIEKQAIEGKIAGKRAKGRQRRT